MKFWLASAFVVLFAVSASAINYDGNNLLLILGQSTSSQNFKEFKSYWALEKTGQNPALGIKVYINPISDIVESIIVTGDNTDLGGSKFKKCNAKLPHNLNLNDDTAALTKKLGNSEKLLGRNTLKFHNRNIAIEVSFTDLKSGEITFIKFSSDAPHHATTSAHTSTNASSTVNPSKEITTDKHAQPAKASPSATGVQAKPKDVAPLTPFKKAILDVFKASKESSFDNIKTDARAESNFWKYKFTYNTKLKILGEKYNMLYSFPFVTSQLDFVVVLKEADSFEKSFDELYHNFEKQLTVNFPPSEGWIATCLPGKDKTQLPDLEFRNDKFGAVILDHSQNPQGQHVLYLRFLLFSD